MEVSQIARTLGKIFNLNEDLCETLSLSHDIGHPPFGHAGEEALNECMINFGGFDHNIQTIRILTFLTLTFSIFIFPLLADLLITQLYNFGFGIFISWPCASAIFSSICFAIIGQDPANADPVKQIKDNIIINFFINFLSVS